MRKVASQISVAILVMFLSFAKIGEAQTNQISNTAFILKVLPGPQYNVPKRFLLFFEIPIYPQIACWIESPDGKYMGTIYVTEGGAKNNYTFAPRGERPEALPVWSHRKVGQVAIPDAVSGATSETAAQHREVLSMPLGRYNAYLEVNRAYDYNETYTRSNSGVNGQLSIVYRASIIVGKVASAAKFAPIGTGSVDGSDGTLRPGLVGITTALSIIRDAEIDYGQ